MKRALENGEPLAEPKALEKPLKLECRTLPFE
jgi:hypothetical protein